MRCRLLAYTLIAALAAAGGASASEPTSDPTQRNYRWTMIPETLVELVVLRPLGAAATAAGLPMFLVSVPFMVPSGEYGWSWDVFVMAPFDYTFTRPLRDF